MKVIVPGDATCVIRQIKGVFMKIKTKELSYEKVIAQIAEHRIRPRRPNPALRWLIGAASKGELKRVNFNYEMLGMERLGRDEPCLILMNHSSFIDL